MKTLSSIKKRIAQLEAAKAKADRIASIQPVTPSWVVTGGANRGNLQKKLQREIDRQMRFFAESQRLEKEILFLKRKISLYEEGEIHLSGQVRKDAPSRITKNLAKDLLKEFIRSEIPIGSEFQLVLNRATTIRAVRYNSKTITDQDGDKWGYSSVLPIVNGMTLEGDSLLQAIRSWKEKSQHA